MVAECILETASSSARSPMTPHANASDQPERVRGAKPLEELTRAIQGERIWHEEDQLCLIHPLLEWLQA